MRVCLLCRIICASQSFPPMPVIASIILLALIVAAVGEGGLMLALRLRSLLDFPFQTCPSTTTITTMRLGRQRRTAVTSRRGAGPQSRGAEAYAAGAMLVIALIIFASLQRWAEADSFLHRVCGRDISAASSLFGADRRTSPSLR